MKKPVIKKAKENLIVDSRGPLCQLLIVSKHKKLTLNMFLPMTCHQYPLTLP